MFAAVIIPRVKRKEKEHIFLNFLIFFPTVLIFRLFFFLAFLSSWFRAS